MIKLAVLAVDRNLFTSLFTKHPSRTIMPAVKLKLGKIKDRNRFSKILSLLWSKTETKIILKRIFSHKMWEILDNMISFWIVAFFLEITFVSFDLSTEFCDLYLCRTHRYKEEMIYCFSNSGRIPVCYHDEI